MLDEAWMEYADILHDERKIAADRCKCGRPAEYERDGKYFCWGCYRKLPPLEPRTTEEG